MVLIVKCKTCGKKIEDILTGKNVSANPLLSKYGWRRVREGFQCDVCADDVPGRRDDFKRRDVAPEQRGKAFGVPKRFKTTEFYDGT